MRGRPRRSIVLTTGCFDILHIGHVRLLHEAAALGDILVVGLNTDEMARRKSTPGQPRPLFMLEGRLAVIAALGCVDYVTWFGETEPSALILQLAPNHFVKGCDWEGRRPLPEDPACEKVGARVHFLGRPPREGPKESSSDLVSSVGSPDRVD